MSLELEVYVLRQAWTRNLTVHIEQVDHNAQKVFHAKPLVMTAVPDGTVSAPAFSLSQTAAQRFMDELWQCGLRPSEGTGSAGALAATQRHLQDMRALALKIKPSET